MPERADFLVVGLGNPGRKYEFTRHNVGFLAVDALCEKYAVRADSLKHRALCAFFDISGRRVAAIKPQTFMNLSGESVAAAARALGVDTRNIIVIFDDAALPPGKVRVKRAGSDGGHNGIKSIIYHLESDSFPRVKIGVGTAEGSLADHVLSEMDSESAAAAKLAPDIVRALVEHGVDAAMREFNGRKAEDN